MVRLHAVGRTDGRVEVDVGVALDPRVVAAADKG